MPGVCDAIKAVADPLRAGDRLGFLIAVESGADFGAPIIGVAEKKDGGGGDGTHFAAHFFEALLEVGAVSSCEDDGEVEVEFRLPFDEFVEAIGHFCFDEGILLLFLDVEVAAVAEVDDICARENTDAFGSAVTDFHEAGAAACDESDRCFGIEKRVVEF